MNRLKTVLALSACALALATVARADSFDIPAGDLKTALDLYARQSGAHLAISGEAVRGSRTKGVKGDLPAGEALTRILSGTGFVAHDLGGLLSIVRNRSSSVDIQPLELAQASLPSGRIEEVLVTARRREEAVENIPISITALSAEDLKTFGVRNFADLEGLVPGLNLGGGGNGVKKDSSPFIRGVGQRETKVTLDSAVATYIDGIYIGRAAGAMLDVTDVGSIQVLRGPQGTLFGRNATGGAISVALNKPTNNWEAQVSANIGNFGRRDISGMINVPFIEDKLMGRLYIASTNSNGYFTNIVDNTKWGGDNRVTGIAQLRYKPTDRITIDVLGERTRIRETPRPQHCAFVQATGFQSLQGIFIDGFLTKIDGYNRYEGLCRQSMALPPSEFASDAAIGNDLLPKARYWVDTSTIGITGTWDIGSAGAFSDLTAKSISAWRKTQQIADEDLDAVPAPYLVRIQPNFDRTTQLSEELQLSGKTLHDRLFLSTGFYFFKEKTPGDDLYLSAGVSPEENGTNYLAEASHERLQTNNHSYALYGQADLDVTPEVQLTGGLRWTTETHWSRYSKAYVDTNSVFDDVTYIVSFNGVQILGRSGTAPIHPILDWRYQSPVYSILTNPTTGNQTLATTYVPGLMIGDALTYSNSAWTPTASFKYKGNDRILQKLHLDQGMVYATYSQGFHSGGVTAGAVDTDAPPETYINTPDNTGIPCPPGANTVNGHIVCSVVNLPGPGYGTANPITFKPEKVTNYEVGFKLAALDRRLQASADAYYMDYTDMQVTSVGNRGGIPIPFIENVGKSVIKGFEAEVVALPLPQWRITLNGSYTDTDIKTWMSQVIDLNIITGLPTGTVSYQDRSDERMPRVPRWQFFVGTEYNISLPDGGTLTPSAAVRFTSSIYNGFDRGSWLYGKDAVTSKPTAFLDGQINWVSENGKMEAALWGKNLFDKEDYLVGGIPLADVTGAVGQVFANPRTFGLTFTYHFAE